MNVKVLALIVVALFTMGAFSVAPAYAQSAQVSVKLVIYPDAVAAKAISQYPYLAVNATNYFVVSYLKNGTAKTLDLYQNTTISVDINSILTFALTSSETGGGGAWITLMMQQSMLISDATTVNIPYSINGGPPEAYITFNGEPYSPAMGILKSVGGGGFSSYDDSTGGALIAGQAELPVGSVISVPEFFVSSSGQYWQLQGGANAIITHASPYIHPSTFNYAPITTTPALFNATIPKQVEVGEPFPITVSFPFPVQSAVVSIVGASGYASQVSGTMTTNMTITSPGTTSLNITVSFPSAVLAPPATPGAVAQVQQNTYSMSKVTAVQVLPPNIQVSFETNGLPAGLGAVIVNGTEHATPYSFAPAYGGVVSYSFPTSLVQRGTTYILTSPVGPLSFTATQNETIAASYITVQPQTVIPSWVWGVLAALVAVTVVSLLLFHRERKKRRGLERGAIQ